MTSNAPSPLYRLVPVPPAVLRSGGEGVDLWRADLDTALGVARIIWSASGVAYLGFRHQGEFGGFEAFRARFANARWQEDCAEGARQLRTLFSDPLRTLWLQGTEFQFKVWRELMRIPSGQTRSYAQLAAAIGQPNASRAVGSAIAKNNIALVIPCHRVIRADGTIGEFRWGADLKRRWLSIEAAGELLEPYRPKGDWAI